jgi:ribosomal protein L11 methyltransferase
LLKRRSDLELVDDYYFTYEQWQGGGLDALRIEGFLIVSPWEKTVLPAGMIRILLDPGVVFGNGLHPTTRYCLRAITCAHRQRPFSRVLDLGTGTGVLAIAVARLGAERVLAADLNPLCVKTANKNVRLNGLDEIIEVVEKPAEDFYDEPADLMVANIHHAVIRDLLEKRVFRKRDRVIISGLMRSQAREVKTQLVSGHFRLLREWEHDMTWFTFLAEIE